MMKRYGSWFLGGLFALPSLACSDGDTPPGGLMLMIAEDGSLGIERLDLTVAEEHGTVLLDRSYVIGRDASLPATLGIDPKGRADASARLQLRAWKAGELVDARHLLIVSIPTDRVAAVPVILGSKCTRWVDPLAQNATSCPSDRTCYLETGTCLNATLHGGRLSNYTVGDESGLGAAFVCEPASKSCDGNVARTCNAEGTGFETVDCADEGRTCAAGVCSGQCVVGEQRCAGETDVQRCDANGRWQVTETCEGTTPVCEDGTCQGASASECEGAVDWIAGQHSVAYEPGQLFHYLDKTYRYEGDTVMTYVNPDCPPDQSGAAWCQAGQYPWSEVTDC